MRRTLVDRNDRCPCGSGWKFKFCHGRAHGPAVGEDSVHQRPAKISARLVEFAAPVLPDVGVSQEEYSSAVKVAALMWNLAVMEDIGESVADVRARIDEIGQADDVAALLARKRRLFPDDLRIILDTHVSRTAGGGYYVQATSAPLAPSGRAPDRGNASQ